MKKNMSKEGARIYKAISSHNHVELDRLLNPHNVHLETSGIPPIVHCILLNDFKCAQVCLKHGANVNHIYDDGSGPSLLQAAVSLCNLEMVVMLLEAGADVTYYYSAFGHSALDKAYVYRRGEDMVWTLIDYGTPVYALLAPEDVYSPHRNLVRERALIVCSLRPNAILQIAMDKNIMRLIGKQIWSMRRKKN